MSFANLSVVSLYLCLSLANSWIVLQLEGRSLTGVVYVRSQHYYC
jgi:hypothetical protein